MKYEHHNDIESLFPLFRLHDKGFLEENEESDKYQLNVFIMNEFEKLLHEKLLTNQT